MASESREIIDSFLAEISSSIGKNIRLNDQGICAFTYEHLMVVIEVPDTVGSFFIYTTLLPLQRVQDSRKETIKKKCLQLNYLQQETRGGCLSLDPLNDEVVFSYTDRVNEINGTDFRNILENFIDTALNLFRELEKMEKQDEGERKEPNSNEMPMDFMNQQHRFMP